MSTGMQGLDPADCRDLVKVLKNSARQLDQAGAFLSQTVARTGWQGPDSQRFRAQWPTNRKRLSSTARDLDDAATQLLREIAEQERASSVDDGGGFWDSIIDAGQNLWEDVTEGVGDVVDGIGDAVDGALDTVRDGLSWLGGEIIRLPAIRPVWNFANQLGHLSVMGFNILTGNPPSVSALAAQVGLTIGAGINFGVNVFTRGQVDLHIFDDGRPYAGDPIPVAFNTSRPELTLPSSASAMIQSVSDAYVAGDVPGTENGDVRILKIEQPDGSFAYIVNIPGTENWGVTGGGQSRDLTSNLMVMAGQSSSAQQAVILAMQRAGIPPGAPVMINGHSQGGMLAIALVSDPAFMAQYNVTNVMTVGSPVDGANVDPRVNILEVAHAGDLVPQLDLGGLRTDDSFPTQPSNVTTVTMDNPPANAQQDAQFSQTGRGIGAGVGEAIGNLPGGPTPDQASRVVGAAGEAAGTAASDAITNHDFNNYVDSMANTDQYTQIADYENDPSMNPFLTNDASRVTAVDVPTGRY